MRIVIVTGMSGAGKSTALNMLEDSGYFCVDNIPVELFSKFIQLSAEKNADDLHVALGIDIRSGVTSEKLSVVLDELKQEGYPFEILFLDAKTSILVKRFKETRRNHPLAKQGRVDSVIETERKTINFLKERADYIIDTSTLLVRELKGEIESIFLYGKRFDNFFVTIVSFGFKYGIPSDADLVFDVRFLPNPYYVSELKALTGNDAPVYDYVMRSESANEFLEKLVDLCKFLIPRYIEEGKYQLVVAIGCTGGRHRSVTIANALHARLSDLNYGLKVEHRDSHKDTFTKK